MRCPKCNSRSMIADHDDVPGGHQRALLCVCCGKRVLLASPDTGQTEVARILGRTVSGLNARE